MNYYIGILISALKDDKFCKLISLLESFSARVELVEKDLIIASTENLDIIYCLLRLRESYPEARFGISQYIGFSQGLTRIAKLGEILISDEIENLVIDNFKITSLGMLSIEGLKNPILVCRIDAPVGRMEYPECKPTPSLISRNTSFQALQNLLTVSRWILLYAPPGSGKTTFIEGLIEKWPEKEIYKTTCPSYIANQFLKPVIDITNQLLRISNSQGIEERQRLIEKRLKELEIEDIGTSYLGILDFLGLAEEESILAKLEMKTRVEIITNTIAEILRRISWVKPVVVIIEDVENLDLSSNDFIKRIMEKLAEDNIIFIFSSCRSQTSIPGLRHFELPEIDRNQCADYVSASINEAVILPATNLFHIGQYLLLYHEERASFLFDQYLGKTTLASFSLPFNDLKTIIKRRVDLLGDKKEILFSLALFGMEIDPTQFPLGHKDSYIFDYFVRKKFLKKEHENYSFTSPLLHEEIYNLVPDKENRHARLADYYRRLEGYEECAAFHYRRAENYPKAVEFLIKSSKMVLKKGGYEAAINYYNQALELCRHQKGAANLETVVAINEGLADIYRSLDNKEKARKYYKVVLDSYKEILKE